MTVEATTVDPSANAYQPPEGNVSTPPPSPDGDGGGVSLGGAVSEGATPPEGGGESWRQKYTLGEDSRLNELSRYKTEDDFIRSGWEARTKLSQRAEAPELQRDATPEQLSQYRSAMGVPETVAEYDLAAPESYGDVSDVEKTMLGDFASAAHAAHMPTNQAKAAVDFFFQSQTANQQALNDLDTQRGEEWTARHHKELGTDYDLRVSAAEAYLEKRFIENPEAKNELLSARLPGGGLLHKNPAFIDMLSDLAIQNGFGDKIEANEVETAGGKPLAQQRTELENLQFSDPKRYNLPQTQAKLDRLIELQLNSGQIDQMGNPLRR